MDVFLYDAVRTPRGKARPDGGLATIAPQELIRQLHRALAERDETPEALILGCVTQMGAQGGNITLVAKLHAGLPDVTAAHTINNYCASGLSAIGHAAAMVAAGQARSALAGGIEMMSQVPFLSDRASYYGDATFSPRTRHVPVVLTADRLAKAERIGRERLDAAALVSQQRSATFNDDPAFQRSRVAIVDREGCVVLDRDECPRPQTTLESLQAMPAAFGALADQHADALGQERFPPLHTLAHAPPLCDGAALALVGQSGLDGPPPRARIVAFAESGGDPYQSLTAGFAAMRKALERAGLTLAEMDRIEFMEAFGVTIAKFLRDYPVDPEDVNVAGGHLAKGHPMGASGAILTSALLDNLDQSNGHFGMVVTSGAAGIGAAMVVERLAL